jgi:hypothetical protein
LKSGERRLLGLPFFSSTRQPHFVPLPTRKAVLDGLLAANSAKTPKWEAWRKAATTGKSAKAKKGSSKKQRRRRDSESEGDSDAADFAEPYAQLYWHNPFVVATA